MNSEAMSNADVILAQWKEAKANLDKWKTEEASLRKLVIETRSEIGNEMHSGMETIDIGWGYELKIEHKLDYKVDNANDSERVDEAEARIIATVGEELGEVIAARLFKRKFELSISEYKKLLDLPNGAALKKIVDAVITIKPASKSVEIKPKK